MYYVYILKSKKDGRLYKGSTSDFKNRVAEHERGAVASTKFYRPWEIIYYAAFSSKVDARREELFLKSGKGREALKLRLQSALEKA